MNTKQPSRETRQLKAMSIAQEAPRPTLYEEADDFALLLHHSLPKAYPEEAHETLQICIPYEGARYDVLRSSHIGTRLTHRLRTGDMLVIPPGQAHAVNWLRPAGILSLHMSKSFLERVLDAPAPDFPDALILHDPFLFLAATELRAAVLRTDTSPTLLGASAALIAYRVAKQAQGVCDLAPKLENPLSPRERTRLAEYIDAHLSRPISISDLAALTGLSQWHFLRRFRATEGATPNRYITRLRIERARELLLHSGRSVTEIALDVGMSPSHFSRSFLQANGVSPQQFRHQCKR